MMILVCRGSSGMSWGGWSDQEQHQESSLELAGKRQTRLPPAVIRRPRVCWGGWFRPAGRSLGLQHVGQTPAGGGSCVGGGWARLAWTPEIIFSDDLQVSGELRLPLGSRLGTAGSRCERARG
jgi:hypothetical protein